MHQALDVVKLFISIFIMTATNTNLDVFIKHCIAEAPKITKARQDKSKILATYIATQITTSSSVALVFICTHNSRRSVFAQVWAQVAANYYGFDQVSTYSGGTSETAVFKETIAALKRNGLMIEILHESKNPIFSIRYHQHHQPILGFSKFYDHSFNPLNDFAAVMTCGDADQNCPFIPQAQQRISLTYEDPKQYDDTTDQAKYYDLKSLEIATELFYTFNLVHQNLNSI